MIFVDKCLSEIVQLYQLVYLKKKKVVQNLHENSPYVK